MLTGKAQERPRAARNSHPALAQGTLDTLDLPEVVEKFQILDHRLRVNDSVDRRVHLVLEGEDIPANLTVRVLEHARVEPAEDVCGIVLRTGLANRGFEGGRQVVAIKRVRRSSQIRTGRGAEPSVT